jgi:hypothetical protein
LWGDARFEYGPETDIFSLGICLLAMLRKKYPIRVSERHQYLETLLLLLGTNAEVREFYRDTSGIDRSKEEGRQTRLSAYGNCTPELADLLACLLDPLPHKRIHLSECISRLESMTAGKSLARTCSAPLLSSPSLSGIIGTFCCDAMPHKIPQRHRAQKMWNYAASRGLPLAIGMMAASAAHSSLVVEPCDAFAAIRPVCGGFSVEGLPWRGAALEFDGQILTAAEWNSLPPVVVCLLAALVCSEVCNAETIKGWAEKDADTLFNLAYEVWGKDLQRFGRPYKHLYGNQTSLLNSWIRLME